MPPRPRSCSPPAPPAKRLRTAPPLLNYAAGLHLAPMVRIGTLPTRLLALEYGANLVWGPEIVDKAIIGSVRTVCSRTGTVKFIKKGRSIFECHPLERPFLIFQLGSASPELAAEAARLVADDVAGVGLNCGCPKPFSLTGGMGAALLREPAKIDSILRALATALPNHPIDVKIRLLPSLPDTLSLVALLADSGISALTVHCRTEPMRSSEPALLHRLRELVDLVHAGNGERVAKGGKEVVVVENGDCGSIEEAKTIQASTGVTSCMIARAAETNPSCFSPDGLSDPVSEIIPLYIRIAMIVDNHYSNSKYTLNAMSLTNTAPLSLPSSVNSSPGTLAALKTEHLNKKERAEMKIKLNGMKDYEGLCGLFGIQQMGVETDRESLEGLLPRLMKRRSGIEDLSVGGGNEVTSVVEQVHVEKEGERVVELAA